MNSRIRSVPTAMHLGRWAKTILLSAGTVSAMLLLSPRTASADDDWHYRYRPGYGYTNYGRGYDGYGYGSYRYYYDDPYHYYSGRRNHHHGPHSAPHVGPHFHWQHGYHYGPHWQRHYDHHGSGGHWGYRPWRPH